MVRTPEDIEEQFQSTLPVGGATALSTFFAMSFSNFNPRSPWGERLLFRSQSCFHFRFQSTLPVGGATCNCCSV